MATSAEKKATDTQIEELETALGPVVIKLDQFVGKIPNAPSEDGESVYDKLRHEANGLYHQITSFLGHVKTHQIIQESKPKISS